MFRARWCASGSDDATAIPISSAQSADDGGADTDSDGCACGRVSLTDGASGQGGQENKKKNAHRDLLRLPREQSA